VLCCVESGRKAVIISIGEIGIAGVPIRSIGAMPAKQAAAAMHEVIAGARATHSARVTLGHPCINAKT
jgi:hypothetical protein